MNFKKLILPLCAAAFLCVPMLSMADNADKTAQAGKELKQSAPPPVPFFKPLTPEQKAERAKIIEEYHKTVMPLHDKLLQKKMELDAFKSLPSVTKEELKAIIEDIVKTQAELRSKKKELRDTLKQKNLLLPPPHGSHGVFNPHGVPGMVHPQGCADCPKGNKGKPHHHPQGHPMPPHGNHGCPQTSL